MVCMCAFVYACVRACVCTCVSLYVIYVCMLMCVSVCYPMHAFVFMTCLLVSLQLTMVEMSLFKAVDLYEMTVHLWEGNTPSKIHDAYN